MTGLTSRQQKTKRAFDLAAAGAGVVLTLPLTAAGLVAATISTREWGIFSQTRIGRDGKPFDVYKLRSMRTAAGTTVTSVNDVRITRAGRVLRATKIDELPQLVNVVRGDMSLVGPRPDVPGWADALEGDDRIVLSVRPGITGPASLAFRDEEEVLARQADPEAYNRDVIWPEKVRLNRAYIENWSLLGDLRYIIRTVLPGRAA